MAFLPRGIPPFFRFTFIRQSSLEVTPGCTSRQCSATARFHGMSLRTGSDIEHNGQVHPTAAGGMVRDGSRRMKPRVLHLSVNGMGQLWAFRQWLPLRLRTISLALSPCAVMASGHRGHRHAWSASSGLISTSLWAPASCAPAAPLAFLELEVFFFPVMALTLLAARVMDFALLATRLGMVFPIFVVEAICEALHGVWARLSDPFFSVDALEEAVEAGSDNAFTPPRIVRAAGGPSGGSAHSAGASTSVSSA